MERPPLGTVGISDPNEKLRSNSVPNSIGTAVPVCLYKSSISPPLFY